VGDVARRARDDPEAPSEDGDLHVLAGTDDGRLARETVRIAEEALGFRAGAQLGEAGLDLDDALAAPAGALARRRHDDGEVVRVIEERPPDHERSASALVDEVAHRALG
jgi:hypothetical protein